MTFEQLCEIAEAVPEIDEPPLFAIYQTSGPGSRDDHAGSAYGLTAVAALENYATSVGITDYSVDQADTRVFLCPAHSRVMFYAYRLPVA